MKYAVEMPWHDIHTKLYNDLFSHSNNIKVIASHSAIREPAIFAIIEEVEF
jgi:hypothetical protein